MERRSVAWWMAARQDWSWTWARYSRNWTGADPGSTPLGTARNEADVVELLSGILATDGLRSDDTGEMVPTVIHDLGHTHRLPDPQCGC